MSNTQALYSELVDTLRETALLASCGHVLGWDEQTYLPPGGATHRANQMALLAGLTHDRATQPRLGELLNELGARNDVGDADGPMAVNIREAKRNYERATKLPRRLVEEMTRATTLGQQAWVGARRDKSFAQFEPWLEQIVNLKREQAAVTGNSTGVPYDALLDEYEPGMTSAEVRGVFGPLREALVPLVAAIGASKKKPDLSILARSYPVEKQRAFGLQAAEVIGFDFERGRLDVAAHPFCSGFGPGDCRLTTRFHEHHFPSGFFGILHEAGHGIYEQGLDENAYGTAMGEAISLGIHESQSLTWENFVGRSKSFWNHFYKPAQEAFPDSLGGVPFADFYAAINDVRPSHIRVEADEVTYSLHIMLRFELEQPLIGGDLDAKDVPAAWNEKTEKYLGITPPDDAMGCLQDIHWSAGLIGYFPTYALGKLYGAQFFDAARRDLGDVDAQFARGEFAPLKAWLNEKIHRRGQQYRAAQLVEVVTGKPLSHAPLLAHLARRFNELYDL